MPRRGRRTVDVDVDVGVDNEDDEHHTGRSEAFNDCVNDFSNDPRVGLEIPEGDNVFGLGRGSELPRCVAAEMCER
jgi:hypothetical protein